MAVSADDTYIATSATDGTVRIFSREGNEQIMQFQLATKSDRCLCVALSADTSRCVAGYDNGVVRTFDLDKIALETKFVLWSHAALSQCNPLSIHSVTPPQHPLRHAPLASTLPRPLSIH